MPDYNSNPNQRYISIKKEKCDSNNLYTTINLDALHKAMSALTPKAFELWIYFSKNQDNHKFWLSKVDFLSWSNVKESSYHAAFNELVKCGYLIQKENELNKFDFYETPREKEENMIEITTHKQ